MVRHRFGSEVEVMAEPGRGLVAEAGCIVAEVLLVARKDQDDLVRWVYLDIGKFSGLAETIDEAIRYQFETRHGDSATGACILAGPSCDSSDVLYEKRPVQLPLALEAWDGDAAGYGLATGVFGFAALAAPLLARLLAEFERRTGLPAAVNTSFNTAGRPIVDSPVDALECFGASPIDLLVLGPFVVRRNGGERR